MLSKRIFSATLIILCCILGAFYVPVFNLIILVFTFLGLYEFFTMLEKKGISIYKYFGIGMGLIIPASIMFKFELTKKWELLFIVLALLFLIMMQLKRRESQGAVVGISTTLFGILYIAWFFSYVVRISLMPNGINYVITVVMITKMTDIGAYLIGSRFGKRPLFPRISPKKSVEGAIGGLLFGVLTGMACRNFVPEQIFSLGHLALLGLVLGIIGQLGDLSESLMKRDCGIKDSANIIPGFGGILDVIDSLLFTFPVFYFYLNIYLKNLTF